MSKVEHDPELVERVYAAILDPRNRYDGVPLAAIDAVRTWDAEHAEPSEADLIAEINAAVKGRGYGDRVPHAWCSYHYHEGIPWIEWVAGVDGVRCGLFGEYGAATPRAALLALRDAVKGERHERPGP